MIFGELYFLRIKNEGILEIQALSSANQLFITRVPQKIKEAKQLISKAKQIDWVSLNDGYSGHWIYSEYGDVPQQWLLVRSTMAKAREEHILNKKILNSTKESLKSFNRLCRQEFSCQADAEKTFDAWQKEQEFSEVFDMNIVEKKQRQKRGRPAIDAEYQAHFCMTGALYTLYGPGRIVKDFLKVLSIRFRLRSYIRHQEKTHFTMSLNSTCALMKFARLFLISLTASI